MKLELQQWIEQQDVELKNLHNSTWIPLMRNQTQKLGENGFEGYRKQFISTECLIVPLINREQFSGATWQSIQRSNPHWAWVDNDRFIGPQEYEGSDGTSSAMYPVLRQAFETGEQEIWHLLQEIEISLGLLKQGDIWVRPSEDYVAVVKLNRNQDGTPNELIMRAEHLRDYLAAKKAALLIGTFVLREVVQESLAQIAWSEDIDRRYFSNGEWEGTRWPIHEGGIPWNQSMAVFKVWRESVDPKDDVPQMPHPAEETGFKSETYEKKSYGRKLEKAQGRIWKSEWVEPGLKSPRIANDEVYSSIPFVVGNQGEPKLSGENLAKYRGWIWFKTSVLRALLSRENVAFQWCTHDTGYIGQSEATAVHFGINDHNYVNVAASDISELPEWAQQAWVAHNVSPEGGLSNELHEAQNLTTPAATYGPEMQLIVAINKLQVSSIESWGEEVFKGLDHPSKILHKVHRFHDDSFEQTCRLAKEISRFVLEKLDQNVISKQLSSANQAIAEKGKFRSLKRLSLLLDQLGHDGSAITRPLAGINDLRQGDAHSKSSKIRESLDLFDINPDSENYYQICLKIIADTADGLNKIAHLIR